MTEGGKESRGKKGHLVIHIDGASRGNPGVAGAGIWITDDEGKALVETGRYLGTRTNNEAEYMALLLALTEAEKLGGERLSIFTDSQLLERQINGLYRVKHPNLVPLYQKALQALKGFSTYRIDSIPREQNREADRLANLAIDRGLAGVEERET
jgi:ribonuclease HI